MTLSWDGGVLLINGNQFSYSENKRKLSDSKSITQMIKDIELR